MPKKVAQVPFIRSLDRGLTILQTVAMSKQPVNLSELSELLGVDRSSAFRLAQTLRRRGFLSTPAGRKDYILGSAMRTLSRQYDWGNMLVRVVHQELKALVNGLNETAHLAIREGRNALCIDSVHARHVIVVAGQTGELVPLYSTAHGKALLADLEEKELRTIFGSDPLQKFTKTTIKTIPALAKECAGIRERGYALDEAEYMEGIRCVAAPIRLNNGMIVGSIGISAPDSRFLKEHYPAQIGHPVRKKDRAASKRIGRGCGTERLYQLPCESNNFFLCSRKPAHSLLFVMLILQFQLRNMQ